MKDRKELLETFNQDKLNYYDKKLLKKDYEEFNKMINFNYEKIMVKKHIGDEARTFNIINQSKPLLSPSRINNLFSDYIFWNIPQKVLLLPRLLGQLVHKFIELRIKDNIVVKLDKDNIEEWTGADWYTIKENWSEAKINLFMEEVNDAVSIIYQYLKDKKIKILDCEKHICNQNYHGFVDMIGYKYFNDNMVSGEKIPMVIDLKITSNGELISSYYLQLSIYRKILKDIPNAYILFYNRNTKKAHLEKALNSKLDETYNAIETLRSLMTDGSK